MLLDSCLIMSPSLKYVCVSNAKLIVRFVNSELTDVLTVQGGRPELDSDIYNPVFNFRQEIRAPNYDPTLMLCKMIDD